MTNIRILPLALMSLLLMPSSWALDRSDLNDPKVVEAFVDSIVEPLMAEAHSPSGAVALMKDGRLIFEKGYGFLDVDKRIPVDPHTTLFRPGSISKLFTWVAVMQMVERGKLDLDADINNYLENFRIKDIYPGQPVTLRHCMTHTPGFEAGGLGYLIINDPEMIVPLSEAMRKYQPERINPPGRVGAYSNYCAALSGLVVENVSGMPFEEYIEKNIFDVLGMSSSTFQEPLPERLNRRMAIAYKYAAGRYIAQPYELLTNFSPAGALAATAEDMMKFGAALLNRGAYNGGRILQPQTLEEMKRTQFTLDERVKGIGLGFMLYSLGDTDTFGHDGGTAAFASHFGVTPSAQLVLFHSFSGPGGGRVSGTLKRAFYEKFFPSSAWDSPSGGDAARRNFHRRMEDFAGTYVNWRGSFSTLEKLMGMQTQTRIVAAGERELLINGSRFAEVDRNLFRNVQNSDLIAFQENGKGEITGFVPDGWPIHTSFRAGFYYSKRFNFALLGLSAAVFLAVVLRQLYQRQRIKALPARDRGVLGAALWAAVSHLWTLIFAVIISSSIAGPVMGGLPKLLIFWLFFPIIAAILTLYLSIRTVIAWKDRLLAGTLARLRLTLVTLCCLSVTWFYYFWNLLGFNYLS